MRKNGKRRLRRPRARSARKLENTCTKIRSNQLTKTVIRQPDISLASTRMDRMGRDLLFKQSTRLHRRLRQPLRSRTSCGPTSFPKVLQLQLITATKVESVQ